MHVPRLGAVVLILANAYFQAESPGQEITLTGKLVRAMAIGGESTGWALELAAGTTINGKARDSVQVSSSDTSTLESLENRRVTASGRLVHRHGVESGVQPVLEVTSIRRASAQSTAGSGPFRLSDSEWLLNDLNGSSVLDNIEATLEFPGSGKVAGNASCNRFFGPAAIADNAMKLGPLAASRKACAGTVMNQEAKYLEALQAAERFEWKAPYLLIYCKGTEKPLRFTRKKATH